MHSTEASQAAPSAPLQLPTPEQVDAVRRKMISASIYPTLLIVVGGLVIAVLLGYVVPRFARIFEAMSGFTQICPLNNILAKFGVKGAC